MSKGEQGAAQSTLHQKGMTNRAPKNPDSSMRCKGGSVNAEATRKDTAKTPGSLGPREA